MKYVLLFLPLVMLVGCNKPSAQQVDDAIDKAVPVLIQGALKHYAKKAPDATKLAATSLSQACDDATQLVQTSKLPAVQLVPLMEVTLLKKIPGDYESITVGALALLAQNIDVNAPTMTDVAKQHCLHVVSAIKSGCTLFLGGQAAMLYGKPEPEIVIEAPELTVTKINPEGFVLVEFKAAWCGPCQRQAENFSALKSDMGPYKNIYCIDVDENLAVSQKAMINADYPHIIVPCHIVFKDGVEMTRHYGIHSRDEMVKWIDEAKATAAR